MKRILLINPNTNAGTTASMLAIAREAASGSLQIEAMTAP
ncbi:MAG: aspartate/glutamate racemase family protein, partial [Rhizobiales bacterium]|nr:aspartate/glutamate racemase family protein [Hyphomicrobiales bacterium]